MGNNQFTNPITKEELDFIKENYYNYKVKELTELLNNKFNKNRNVSHVKIIANKVLKLKKFTADLEEIRNYLRENVHKLSRRQATENVNRLFNCNYKVGSIKMMVLKLGLKFSKTEGFKNKLQHDLGHEIVTKRGFVLVKTESNKYKPKQRIVWEQHYKQKLPKGKIILFADGDKTNCNIDNLLLVDANIPVMLNRYNFYGHSPEITKAGISICETQLKLKERLND